MDRRKQKTRNAIFNAFTALLARKTYAKITVQEIIDAADIGRTTFYSHFETKDALLKDLCEDLFGHIIENSLSLSHRHGLPLNKQEPNSVFCHLLQHLQENNKGICSLLSSESSEVFMRYFKESLAELVELNFIERIGANDLRVPKDLLLRHISVSFVELSLWWIKRGMKETPSEIDAYFSELIEPLL